jgi:hypothetical protein
LIELSRFCKRTNSGALPRGDIDCHRIHPKTKFVLRKLFTCKKKLENSVCEERKLLDYGWFIFQTDDQ